MPFRIPQVSIHGESPSLISSGADLSLLASAPEGDATFAGGLREVNGRDLI